MQLVIALTFIAAASCLSDTSRDDGAVTVENLSCENVFCSMGKECVMENKKPICACIDKCQGPDSPVCGSNGTTLQTYQSECHLFKDSCERENVTIILVAAKSCDSVRTEEHESSEKIEKDETKVKPVVCMQENRDGFREAIIKWISSKLDFDADDVSYKGVLWKYFLSLDLDKDEKIDTMEFLKLLDEDIAITKVLGQGNSDNPVLKGLCSTELIAITDKNSDYKLGFDEFSKCLDPNFTPPKEFCELGGDQYKDDDDIPAECDNTCKCACGHWVCTQNACPKNSKDSNRAEDKLV